MYLKIYNQCGNMQKAFDILTKEIIAFGTNPDDESLDI